MAGLVESWRGNVAVLPPSSPHPILHPITRPSPTPTPPPSLYPSSNPPSTSASIPDFDVGDLSDSWLQQTIEDAYQQYGLPPILHSLDDVDRMGIAYACEARNIVQNEVDIAERRFRQILIIARIYHVQFMRAQEKLHQIQERLDKVVDVGVKDASSPGSDIQQSPEHKPEWYQRIPVYLIPSQPDVLPGLRTSLKDR